MISKRARISATPQESLRQHAISFSKGIDVTRPITDNTSTLSSKNLIVNRDGSLSLRKPLTYLNNYGGGSRYVHVLYDQNYDIRIYGTVTDTKLAVVNRTSGDALSLHLDFSDADGKTYSLVLPNSYVEFGTAAGFMDTPHWVINTASSTVVAFKLGTSIKVDNTTYYLTHPDANIPSPIYRYARITINTTDNIATISIMSPEQNVLSLADEDIPLNPNLLLDNPYALRDTYGRSAPTVKQIVAYTSVNSIGKRITETLPYPGLRLKDTSVVKLTESLSYDSDGHRSVPLTTLSRFEQNSSSQNYSCINLKAFVTFTQNTETSVVYDPEIRTNTYRYPRISDGTNTYTDICVELSTSLTDANYASDNAITVQVLRADFKAGTFETLETINTTCKVLTNNGSEAFYNRYFKKQTNVQYYAYVGEWSRSTDGNTWESVVLTTFNTNAYASESPTYREDGVQVLETADTVTRTYQKLTAYPFVGTSETDILASTDAQARSDALCLTSDEVGYTYRYRVLKISPLKVYDDAYDINSESAVQFKIDEVVGTAMYSFVFSDTTEVLISDFKSAVLGDKLYYKKSIFSYGNNGFANNITVSDPDSAVTPLYNNIELDATHSTVATAVLPWRDYVISATDSALYLSSKVSTGWLTKTVNTKVGIPYNDSRCIVPTLNGIIFKSGSFIYLMYPNLYSAEDTVINLADISEPISEHLEAVCELQSADYRPFAFTTESEYVLMIPTEDKTCCFRYDYVDKHWEYHEYPVILVDHYVFDYKNIHVYNSNYAEFRLDYVPESMKDDTSGDLVRYADTVSATGYAPIEFSLDTGQRTDNLVTTKQFVESKLMFATLHARDSFPMQVVVHIDGDAHITTMDVNTDAPFWKKDTDDINAVGTLFALSSTSDSFNTLRQLQIRYSGKGRSVRHILSGTSYYNFKLYEIYVRYKNLTRK